MQKLAIEIKSLNNNIDKMYIDKIEGKISEEMYERLFQKLSSEGKEKEKQYNKLKNERESIGEENNTEIEKVIKEFLTLERPTPEIMKIIINRIEIHQDKQVDLIFNFQKLNNFLNNKCLL